MRTIVGLLLFCGVQTIALSNSGHEVGGGGDGYAAEFVQIASELANQLIHDPLGEVRSEELEQAIRSTKVTSAERLFLKGQEVDAINYPDAKRIEVSRKRWDGLDTSFKKKYLLVFHEFLGILKVKDDTYQVSSQMNHLGICGRTPGVREALEKIVKKSCYRIIPDDLLYIEKLEIKNFTEESLKEIDFAGLSNLKMLHLWAKHLKSVPSRLLKPTPNLISLRIHDSKLLTFPDGFLSGLKLERMAHLGGAYIPAKTAEGYQGSNLCLSIGDSTKLSPQFFTYVNKVKDLEILSDYSTGLGFGNLEDDLFDHFPIINVLSLRYGYGLGDCKLCRHLSNKHVIALDRLAETGKVKKLILYDKAASDLVGPDFTHPRRLKSYLCKNLFALVECKPIAR